METISLVIRFLLIILMLIVAVVAVTEFGRTKYSFGFLGYIVSTLGQIWIFAANCKSRGNTLEFSKVYRVFCQVSWTFNTLITLVFWGFLYHVDAIGKFFKRRFITHVDMILLHLLPILMEIRELYRRPMVYSRGDYLWAVLVMVLYGGVNYIDTIVSGYPLYPMLNWKDATSVIFIVFTLVLSYSLHCLGSYISCSLHKPKAEIKAKNS